MAQINWVFLDNHGGRHRVGLYHGDRSGHVMIHCNMRVMQVDFSVKDTKMYSFFIEDELCEVILAKEHGAFGYEFRVNKQVDTPRNRVRKIQRGLNRKYMVFFVLGMVTLLGGIFWGLQRFGKSQEAQRTNSTSIVSKYTRENRERLSQEGKTTVAKLHLALGEKPGEQKITYVLLGVDSLMEQGEFQVADMDPIILPNGFPFKEGDEFDAVYLPADPQVHRVDFFQPSRSTTSRYILLAQTIEQRLHPTDSPEKCICRVLTTAESESWPSIANFIFQEKTPEENARHNHDSYLRLLRSPDLSMALQRNCWDK